jgi:hypothetical protein
MSVHEINLITKELFKIIVDCVTTLVYLTSSWAFKTLVSLAF